ncbi:MAG: OmpA family protein [Pseudomonadota bacterium]
MKRAMQQGLAGLIGLLCWASAIAQSAQSETNYLSLAHGTIPIAVDEQTESLRTGIDRALVVIDGNPNGFSLTPRPGGEDTTVRLTYQLPASTRFERFDVPNVLETPSPSQTFFQSLIIQGSSEGPEGPFRELANHSFELHEAPGQVTEIASTDSTSVRWVQLIFSGGLDVQREQTFFEFSELRGFGEQDTVPLLEGFSAKWSGRGVRIELKQAGPRVTGCYDRDGELTGTVRGNLLSATGTTRNSGTPSAFLLTVDDEGRLIGVRSSNGAPFRLYKGDPDTDLVTDCSEVVVALPGCDSILHGIQFDFDSDVIRTESEPLLNDLYAGLQADTNDSIVIIGHSSSEGEESYNAALSQRRAASVTRALVQRGLASDRISAQGVGESSPIANNDTDAGRALNRRVEVVCAD